VSYTAVTTDGTTTAGQAINVTQYNSMGESTYYQILHAGQSIKAAMPLPSAVLGV